MPSSLVKIVVIYFIIALVYKIALPEAGIGHNLVSKFIKIEENIDIGEINTTLPQQPTGIETVQSFATPIFLVWNFIAFAIDILTLPIGVANYMLACGAPTEAVLLAVIPFVLLAIGAIIDFTRSGS